MAEIMSFVTSHASDFSNYLVYAAIVIVTVIGIFKCLVPLWNGARVLRRAIRRLQREAGQDKEKPSWQDQRFLGRRLKGSWVRFLQNAEQLDRRGLPCNVEDYINDDTVTHGPGNATLAQLIPSLLTSLGILGTFMGMTSGLSGLDVSSTTAMMNGIQKLLQGMQYAFGTSVAGVACSIAFNMCNRVLQGSSYRAIDDFVESFTQLAMQRPLDNDVQLICQNQDRNHLLGTVTDTISNEMTTSIEGAVSRAMQPVCRSLDNFLIGATHQQVQGVGRIVNLFVDRMNESLGGQFISLGKILTEVNKHQHMTMMRVEQTINTASGIVQEANRLHGISQEVMDRFGGYIAEISEARRRDGAFEQQFSSVMSNLQSANAEQMRLLRLLQQEETAMVKAVSQMQNVPLDVQTSLSSSLEGFLSKATVLMDSTIQTFEKSTSNVLLTLKNQLEQDKLTTREVSDIQKVLTTLEACVQEATNRLIKLQESKELN